MSSLFYININDHDNISKTLQKGQGRTNQRLNKLLIDPQSITIIYQKDKTYVQKILLQNTFGYNVNFKIIQPKNALLNVKYKKSQLNHKQTNELFLFFNSQNEKSNIEDQFIVMLERERLQVHVPIMCRAKFKSSHRKLSVNKTIKSIQPQTVKKDGQKKPKSNGLALKRRPMTAKKQQFQADMQNIVNNFLERFSQIREFVKQKNVKKQIFIGEKALSNQKHNRITMFNEEINQYIIQKIKKIVESRNKVQFSEQGPLVRNFQGIILRWSKQKNIPRLVYQKGLAKLQQKVRQYLVELRFQKIHRIFSLYQQFQESEEHYNLPVHKRHELYVQKLQKRLNRKQQISLELNFDWSSVVCTRLPGQRETFRKVEFGINPRIGFDNWVPIQQGARYSHEVMGYQKRQPIPEWLCQPRFDIKDRESQSTSAMKIIIDSPINQNEQQRVGSSIFRQEDSTQLDFILEMIKIQKKQESQAAKSEKFGSVVGSRLEFKINSDQNSIKKSTNKKSSSRQLSIRNIPSFEREEDKHDQNITLSSTCQPLISYFFKKEKQGFHQFISQEQNSSQICFWDGKMLQREIDSFILKQIGKERYYLDYMNMISYTREQQLELQCRLVLNRIREKYHPIYKRYYHPVNLVESFLSASHNNIIRKISKEDKHQFDRLKPKDIRILQMIESQQRLGSLSNYRLRSEIDLEASEKYRSKAYQRDEGKMEKELQNLQIVKYDSLGKAHLLQIYSYQAAKNKQLSFFLP